MSESSGDEELDLTALAERLVTEGMPVQTVIADEAGVSQSTVSRAIQGKIKTSSKGARRLWDYASGRMAILETSGAADGSSRAPRRRGGHRTRNPSRRPPPTRSLSGDREALAEVAIKGLRDYLHDSFDPMLIIEQLAMLRRAQDPKRKGRSDAQTGRERR
jgi:hypothetical protein